MKCPHCGHTWGNPRKAEASKRHKLRLAAREESERTGEPYDEIVKRWGCEMRPEGVRNDYRDREGHSTT